MVMSIVKPNIFDGEKHRPMTDAEFEQWQTDAIEAQAQTEAEIAKQEARQVLLNKLGITSDEAKLLIS